MRIALISDSHTKKSIEFIYNYLKGKPWKLDLIIINGDIIGENEAREGYGFKFNKALFHAGLPKNSILKSVFPDPEKLKKISEIYLKGINKEETDLEMANLIKEYIEYRYDTVLYFLKKFSTISRTLFNIGTYESPLLYNVIRELAFLIEVPEPYLRKIALLSNYREAFKSFLAKIKDPKLKNLKYIAGTTYIVKDTLIAGIPGLNPSSNSADKMSEFQEKITKDLLGTVARQLSYVNKLIIVNQTQGKLRKSPFSFRPQSMSVRKFIESLRGKLRHKVFVQSYHHFMTTHFYEASEFKFILNNSAVNNSLFNILEISNNISVYDVDPRLDKVRKLKLYNYNLSDYDSPEERLSLNYENSKEIIKERSLEGCYYM